MSCWLIPVKQTLLSKYWQVDLAFKIQMREVVSPLMPAYHHHAPGHHYGYHFTGALTLLSALAWAVLTSLQSLPVDIKSFSVSQASKSFHKIDQNPPPQPKNQFTHQKMQPLQAWVRPALWQHRATLQHDCVACGEGEKMLCPRGTAGGMKGRGPSPPKSLGHWLYQKCWDHFQSDSVQICITQLNPHPEPHTAQGAEWQVAS